MQIILLASFRQQNKILETDIPFRSETPRYFYKLNWSSLYALLVFKIQYNGTCPLLTQNPNADIQKRAYFSVTSLVLNDVNVRDSNVIKPSFKESVLIRIIIWKAQGVPQLNNVAHPKHQEE